MRLSTREDLAPAEIVDTSVVVSPEQEDAARRMIRKHAGSDDDAKLLFEALDLQ